MKAALFFSLVLFGFLQSRAQTVKFSAGDIGVRYQLDYNAPGSLQNQVSVSGFVLKNLELGGTVSLVYDISRIYFSGYATLPHSPTNDTLYNYEANINTWSYSLGFSPYLVYHFFHRSKNFDLYLGGLVWFGISENSSSSYTNYIASGYTGQYFPPVLESDGSDLANPPSFSFGAGPIIGFQYFFSKNFALGIQASVFPCAYFTKGNSVLYVDDSWGSFNNNSYSANIVTNSSQGMASLGNPKSNAYAGVTLSYYISKKPKTTTAVNL